MCQKHLASVSQECFWCGGGYIAGLGNYIPHDNNCPTLTGDENKKEQILEERSKVERERNEID